MNFYENDVKLTTEGMGIAFYSPETNKDIPEGYNFLKEEFWQPEDVVKHIYKGDVVGFCTGTGGDYTLKFREGYPHKELDEEYPLSLRLGIDIQDDKLCMIDLFWLMEWSKDCPKKQILTITPGFYHITLCTKKPESGIWGDEQTIYVYLNKLDSMPKLKWNGVPTLFED